MNPTLKQLITYIYQVLIILTPILAIVINVYLFRPFADAYELTPSAENANTFETYVQAYQAQALKVEDKLPAIRQKLDVPSILVAIGHKQQLAWAGVTGIARHSTAITWTPCWMSGNLKLPRLLQINKERTNR